MKNHVAYLRYLILHKKEVYRACRLLKVPLHRAIFHDISKFFPSEWFPYVHKFYHFDGSRKAAHNCSQRETKNFDKAWNHHQKYNRHHWQYWVLILDSGEIIPLEMPDTYIREMVADWIGAGRAITEKYEFLYWYNLNKERMKLHIATRLKVEQYLQICQEILKDE